MCVPAIESYGPFVLGMRPIEINVLFGLNVVPHIEWLRQRRRRRSMNFTRTNKTHGFTIEQSIPLWIVGVRCCRYALFHLSFCLRVFHAYRESPRRSASEGEKNSWSSARNENICSDSNRGQFLPFTGYGKLAHSVEMLKNHNAADKREKKCIRWLLAIA